MVQSTKQVSVVISARLDRNFSKTFLSGNRSVTSLDRSVRSLSRGLVDLNRKQRTSTDLMGRTTSSLKRGATAITSVARRYGTLADKLKVVNSAQRATNTSLTASVRIKGEAARRTDQLKRREQELGSVIRRTSKERERANRIEARGMSLKARGRTQGMQGASALGASYIGGRILGSTIGQGVGYTSEVSRVNALMATATAEQQAMVKAEIDRVGATTAFTQREAAEGASFLAMAGFKPENIVGALDPTVSLAAAGGIGMGDAADIMSNAMSAFEMPASEAGTAASILAKTFTTSNTDLIQLGEAMNYAAANAHSVGMSMSDTSGMIGLLGNIGIQGSRAGTGIRGMMARMASESSLIKSELGVDVGETTYDKETGEEIVKFGNVPKIISALGDRLAQETNEIVREQLIGAVFGRLTATQAKALMASAKRGELQTYLQEVGSVSGDGFVKGIRDKMLDNFGGDMKMFGSAMSANFIQIFESLAPLGRALIQVATGFARVIGFALKFKPLAFAIGAVSVAVVGLLGAVGATLSMMALWNLAMGSLVTRNAMAIASNRSLAASFLTVSKSSIMGGTGGILSGGFKGLLTKGKSVVFLLVGMLKPALAAIGAVITGISAPVWAIIAAVAAVAAAVWFYWKPIAAFFRGFSEGFGEVFAPIFKALAPLRSVLSAIGSMIAWLGAKFIEVLSPDAETIINAEGFGKAVGKLVANVSKLLNPLVWMLESVGTTIEWVSGLFGDDSPSARTGESSSGSRGGKTMGMPSGGYRIPDAAPVSSPPEGLLSAPRSGGSGYASFSPNMTIHINGSNLSGQEIAQKISREQERLARSALFDTMEPAY